MSGLQARGEDTINGVDVREQGSALRVATNTPHLVSLGTGRLSTAVTLHPIKQGRVTIGSDPTCDIYVLGTGVAPVHCRVENSHGVVTLYPTSGSTLLDGLPVDKPTRLSQGSMLTIGRSNYLRFNHPEEAKLMKSVLPSAHVSMAPVQFRPNDHCLPTGYQDQNQPYKTTYNHKENTLSQLEHELDMSIKDLSRKKPPVAPRKPYKDDTDSNSDHERDRTKVSSIMAKVSKFEYYAKQQKNIGRSQFYTSSENEISPKVFSSNSLTVNTPAKDVLGGKTLPNYMKKEKVVSENNDTKNGSYTNVVVQKAKIQDIVRNFDDSSRLPKKVNNDQSNIYGKINTDKRLEQKHPDPSRTNVENSRTFDDKNINLRTNVENTRTFEQRNVIPNRTNIDSSRTFDERNMIQENSRTFDERNINVDNSRMIDEKNVIEEQNELYGRIERPKNMLPSPAYDRNPQYAPVYCQVDRRYDAEHMRIKAYQDRIKEEETKEAETARLEEILNMCAEYERQIASGTPLTPTEKRPHNKIITNGSLPRSTYNSPNLVQTQDGYYKFETSHSRNNSLSQSQPVQSQRNVSSYENYDIRDQLTPEVTITHNYENVGRMDEIGIPVFDETPNHELSSPIMIRKLQNGTLSTSPVGSPYENVFYNRNNVLKPKSPNTQSPRTRIKTTFAHRNLPSPQYFVFPTPPAGDSNKKPNFDMHKAQNMSPHNQKSPQDFNSQNNHQYSNVQTQDLSHKNQNSNHQNQTLQIHTPTEKVIRQTEKVGIEKQLSLEEEIPMIDDADISNDIELRYSKVEKTDDQKHADHTYTNKHGEEQRKNVEEAIRQEKTKDKRDSLDEVIETQVFINKEIVQPEKLQKNKSFDDVKKELMADIPELEEFEKDLKENKREKIIKNITENIRKIDIEVDSIDSVLDDNVGELKTKYEKLKEERRRLMTEIHEIKNKMTEIRSQEDDILRELEMEKALIKGEYDSEIAILNIEQKKKADLLEKAKKIEEDMKQLKERQETRQNEMRDRVEIATLKVERIQKDIKDGSATVEELQNAQDILDNETKIYEDLEFQHLEEESELLANREDLQNEIILLSKKIDCQKARILTLKSEANDNLTSALDETKILQAEYVRLLNQVEDLTSKVQAIEKELKPMVNKLNDIERTQSPDSAFYTDQTRAKSGEFGYSPQSSDSDDLDITKLSNFETHTKEMKEKFNSIDRMSQSMILDIERRIITDIIEIDKDESPSKSSTSSKEKKGFWERNFDSLKRKKKPKSPEKVDIMSQSLNENMFFNNDTIEQDTANSSDRFNSLKHSKKKDKTTGPVKSNSSSKIPTFAALGKIIKKDSFGKKSRENSLKNEDESIIKNRFTKNTKPTSENKYLKAKSNSPDKQYSIKEEVEPIEKTNTTNNINNYNNEKINFESLVRKASIDNGEPKMLHRKSCGDEPNLRTTISEFQKISESGKIPSQDDIDRISKVTMDAPILSSDTDMNSLGKRTLDSLMEIERKRMEMLEEQGCQVIENEREKISELKRRVQDETKKLWDQKSREQSKSIEDINQFESITSELGKNDNKNLGNDNLGNKNDKIDQKEHNIENRRHDEHQKPENADNRNKNTDHGNDNINYINHNLNHSYYNENHKIDHKNDLSQTNDSFESHYASVNESFRSANVELRRKQNDRSGREKIDDSSLLDDSFNLTNSTIYEESSGLMSSSIEELQVRNSRTESTTEDEKRSDSDSRPLSHASDFSRENILQLSGAPRRSRRGVAPYSESQRPLTRYLPVDRDDFDLRRHVESAGHQIELCPYLTVTATSCRGYLHKLGAKFHTWSKRWFVFDRETKTFVYYWDKSEKKPRGGAYFQVIEEVYLDHGNTSKSPSPQTTFIVKTRQRRYYLMAPSGEAARIWIDVIFTGAQGYTEYLE